MPERLQWFDRRFAFEQPIGLYPNIVERLRGTPARLEERVRGLPKRALTRRVADAWSIQENVGHLMDLEPLWIRRVEQLIAGEAELAPADLANRKTHEAAHNGRPLGELLRGFRKLRGKLVTLLDGADDALIIRSALHPRLQTPMRVMDLALFVAEHDDHHLVRVGELIRQGAD